MRRLITYVVIFILAIAVGLIFTVDSGYILLKYYKWTVEMPIWFGAISLIIIFVLFHYLLRLIRAIRNCHDKWTSWRHKKAENKANLDTSDGFFQLVEGDMKSAKRLFVKNVKNSSIPEINYFFAAYCAQKQNINYEVDYFISKLVKSNPKKVPTIYLMQASLQVFQKQFKSAQILLERLQSEKVKYPMLFKLLTSVYKHNEDWISLEKLLPVLEKKKLVDSRELIELQWKVYNQKLLDAVDAEQLIKQWKKLPRNINKNIELRNIYCKQLISFNKDDLAAKLILGYLDEQWDNRFVELYGLAKTSDTEIQLEMAEKWHVEQKYNATLLLALARINARLKLWARATEYVIESLGILKSAQAYYLLGYIYEKISQFDNATQAYKTGLMQGINNND